MNQVRAIAEADLDDPRRLATELGVQVAGCRGVVQSESRPQPLEGALLAIGHASGAQHEGAHAARMGLRIHRRANDRRVSAR